MNKPQGQAQTQNGYGDPELAPQDRLSLQNIDSHQQDQKNTIVELSTKMSRVEKDIQEIKNDLKSNSRNIHIGIGVLVVLTVLAPIIIPLIFNNKSNNIQPIINVTPPTVNVTISPDDIKRNQNTAK